MTCLERTDHPERFGPHDFPQTIAGLGEVRMDYAVAGEADAPALPAADRFFASVAAGGRSRAGYTGTHSITA